MKLARWATLSLFAMGLSSACSRKETSMEDLFARPDHPLRSPTSSQTIQIQQEEQTSGSFWKVRVLDSSGNVVAEPTERFAVRHRTLVTWGDGGRFWVYSGDLGLFYGEPGVKGSLLTAWLATAPDAGQPTPPEHLKSRLPQLFQRSGH